MRIFLTGQDGFIGGEVLRQARAAGHEVLGLEKPFRMENPPWEKIGAFAPEACIHCAWIATPGEYLESPENICHREWSLTMIERLAAIGTRRFVVAGTCAEYGCSTDPLREESEPDPSTLYGCQKNLLRVQLQEAAVGSGFELLWARLFYPYGPGEHPDRLISLLIRNAMQGKRTALKQPGALRDYIHVQDVAQGLLLLAEKGAPGIFNLGTGKGTRLTELRTLVEEACGRDLVRSGADGPEEDSDRVVADITRISAFGWSPRFDITRGLNTYFPQRTAQP